MGVDISKFNLQLGRVNPADEQVSSRRTLKQDENLPGASFTDMLKDAIGSVNQASLTADKQVEDVVSGKSENVHEVMISLQKAQLSFQLMLEIRNKALETYQELSRMQI